jgi:hypothetical protein
VGDTDRRSLSEYSAYLPVRYIQRKMLIFKEKGFFMFREILSGDVKNS